MISWGMILMYSKSNFQEGLPPPDQRCSPSPLPHTHTSPPPFSFYSLIELPYFVPFNYLTLASSYPCSITHLSIPSASPSLVSNPFPQTSFFQNSFDLIYSHSESYIPKITSFIIYLYLTLIKYKGPCLTCQTYFHLFCAATFIIIYFIKFYDMLECLISSIY